MKRTLLLALLLVGTAAAADDWKLVVRMKGKVQSSVDRQVSWQGVFSQRMLRANDAARTLQDSKARIQLPDGSVAVMAPNTVAVMHEFDAQAGKVRFDIDSGGLRSRVTKAFSHGRYEVNTRNGVLAAQGTDYSVYYEPSGAVICHVFEGVVTADSGPNHAELHPGQTARLHDGQVDMNPPDFNVDDMPDGLGPDRPEPPFAETSTYFESDAGKANGAFTQVNSVLLPSDAARIGDPGFGQPTQAANASTTGVIHFNLDFRSVRP